MVKKLTSIFAAIALLVSVFAPINILAYDTDISYLPTPTEIFIDDSFNSVNDARKNADDARAAKLAYIASGTVSDGIVTLPEWKTLVFSKNSITAETDILVVSVDLTTAVAGGYSIIRINGQNVVFFQRKGSGDTADIYLCPNGTKTGTPIVNVTCNSVLRKLSVVLKRTETENGYSVALEGLYYDGAEINIDKYKVSDFSFAKWWEADPGNNAVDLRHDKEITADNALVYGVTVTPEQPAETEQPEQPELPFEENRFDIENGVFDTQTNKLSIKFKDEVDDSTLGAISVSGCDSQAYLDSSDTSKRTVVLECSGITSIQHPYILKINNLMSAAGDSITAEYAVPVSDIGDKKAGLCGFRLLDKDKATVTGKLTPGEDFYFTASVMSNASEDFSYSVYLGVYDKNSLLNVYKSSSVTLSGGSLGWSQIKFRIPKNVKGDYFVKAFVFNDETQEPLSDAVSFDAANAYTTEKVTYNGNSEWYLGNELFIDPSFENDNLITSGWTSRSPCDIERSNAYVMDGSYSCRVYNRNATYESISQNITENLKKEGQGVYRLVYNVLQDAGADAACEVFNASIKMLDKEGNEIYLKNQGNAYDICYVRNMTSREWSKLEKFVNINVPDNLHDALFYVETVWQADITTNPDYYMDDCSLRKTISYEDYVKENACVSQEDPALEIAQLIEKYEAEHGSSVKVYPKNSEKIIKNPYKGLNYYTTTLDFSTLNLTQSGASISNVVYARYGWSDLEPEEGKYNFDKIRKNIEIVKAKNMMLGIGIGTTIVYNSKTDCKQQAPEWLFESKDNGGCGAPYYSLQATNKTIKLPYYNDSVFMEKMQNFLNAFAEEFNDNPNIAYVDMRNYGNWGEWHFASDAFKEYLAQEQAKYTKEDFRKLVDMFKNFRLPLAMFTSNTDALNYAIDTYNTGVRVDGTLNPDNYDTHLKMKAVDGKNFSVAEWFMQPESFYEGKKYERYYDYLPIYIEKVIREGRASYISLGYWNPETFYTRFTDLSNRIANETGYWFKPSKITYPEVLTNGLFTMTMKNDGSTQLYAGYKRNSALKLALADDNGNIIDTLTLENVNPEDWKAGKYTYVSSEYSFKNTSGAKKLYLGIFSDADNTEPDIKLGIDAEPINGWYDVTAMASNTYKSDNKLYTSSYPYADYGYGYRDARYAFDNNADTFWASEIRKDEFMEIDFGENMPVSSMMINGVEAVNVNYSVMGYDGKNWVKLYTGTAVKQGENLVTLSGQKVSKVRLVFNETKSGVVKIKEMYLD